MRKEEKKKKKVSLTDEGSTRKKKVQYRRNHYSQGRTSFIWMITEMESQAPSSVTPAWQAMEDVLVLL